MKYNFLHTKGIRCVLTFHLSYENIYKDADAAGVEKVSNQYIIFKQGVSTHNLMKTALLILLY